MSCQPGWIASSGSGAITTIVIGRSTIPNSSRSEDSRYIGLPTAQKETVALWTANRGGVSPRQIAKAPGSLGIEKKPVRRQYRHTGQIRFDSEEGKTPPRKSLVCSSSNPDSDQFYVSFIETAVTKGWHLCPTPIRLSISIGVCATTQIENILIDMSSCHLAI